MKGDPLTSFLETLIIAVALGCDAFAVGLGVGVKCGMPRQVFRLSFHFGFFQFLMPLIGGFAGSSASSFSGQWGPWIAFGLLAFIGAKMLHDAFHPDAGEESCPDPTRGFSLVMLSVATSIDALGVGISFGVMGARLFMPAVVIGIVAAAMTWVAMSLGKKLSSRAGSRAEIFGGLLLLSMAFKVGFL